MDLNHAFLGFQRVIMHFQVVRRRRAFRQNSIKVLVLDMCYSALWFGVFLDHKALVN